MMRWADNTMVSASMRMRLRRCLGMLVCLIIPSSPHLLIAAELNAPSSTFAGTDVPPDVFVKKFCAECHGSTNPEGGVDLSALSTGDIADAALFRRWVKVHDRVKAGEMPPKDAPQPEATQLQAFLASLSARLTEADVARRADSGRAAYRRLTRQELEYTLGELLGVPGMPVIEDLPPDGTVQGFNKVSEALDISHVQMARYFEVAHRAVGTVLATRPEPPVKFSKRFYPSECGGNFHTGLTSGECVLLKDKRPDPAWPIVADQMSKEQYAYLSTTVYRESKSAVGIFRHTGEAFSVGLPAFSPLIAGRYKIRASVWSFLWDAGRVKPSPKTQVFSLRNDRGVFAMLDAPSLDSKVHELEVWLEPNDHIKFNTASLEEVHVYLQPGRAAKYQGPGIALDWIEIEGPIVDEWPSVGHRRLFGDLPLLPFVEAEGGPLPPERPIQKKRRTNSRYPSLTDHYGKTKEVWTVTSVDPLGDSIRLLTNFLPRAFRRPVKADEVARYVDLCNERMMAGDCFEDALRATYEAALCSPEFLFRIEPAGKLDSWSIASRLSYFLWDSPPDDYLRGHALAGLKSPDGVAGLVRKMLEDPKSDRFVRDFLDQWLSLNEIAATTPDKQLYPEYLPYMEECMTAETRAYFRQMLTHNLGISYLVDSDFSMLNRELCDLYGIDVGLEGHEPARVLLPAGSHRGGLLTQASILKITANGTTTSPVKRGAWIMDRLVGLPPDPPPPSVTAIDPDLRGATTIREQLALHRNNPGCASCHSKMDPPGFALESYDVIGRLRDRYRSKEEGEPVDMKVGEGHYPVRFKLGLPVDCTGQTVDGTPFKDLDEFKKILLKDERQLARNFVERLLVYATGREIGFADRPAIEKILDACAEVKANERSTYGAYRIRNLIEEVVRSELFLTK